MNEEKLEKVKAIAQKARRWATRNRKRYYFDETLGGMCGIASGKLWEMLTAEGINARLAIRNTVGEGHCFVLVDDCIVDITATQFGPMRPVEIRTAKEARKQYHFWRATKVHKDAESLREHQQKTGWPREQTALNYTGVQRD